jgi:protein TonB
MGIEGTVILQADVSEQGIPLQVRLFQSSGNDLLDQSALSTVAQWRFTPARKDGVITRSTVRIPITFSLKVQAKK